MVVVIGSLQMCSGVVRVGRNWRAGKLRIYQPPLDEMGEATCLIFIIDKSHHIFPKSLAKRVKLFLIPFYL